MVETPPTLPPPPPGAEPNRAIPPPPPPPGRAVRSDGPARSVAATLVAAVGALLLLAAAGTFLAVSWDAVPIPARVALVGAATAAAIAGGAGLRRRLPAVGAVVFHLGIVLVPVDVLGLCLQLGAERATTWIAVGAATAITLPLAGALGRAPVLGALGLSGIPIVATGLTDAGVWPVAAPGLVAVAAVVVAVGGWPGTTAVWRRAAAPLLATTVVVGPLVVAAVAAVVGALGGSPLVTATATGWQPSRWQDVAVAGIVAVATVAVCAWRTRSQRLAILVAPLSVGVIVGLVLAGDAPRLALLLPGPLLLVTLELVARLLADDPALARPARVVAATAEAIAALTLPAALALATLGDASADLELAVATAVMALGWTLAAGRRAADQPGRPLAAAAAVTTSAAATVLAVPSLPIAALLLLAGATGALAVRAEGMAGLAASIAGVVLGAAAYAAVSGWEAGQVGATTVTWAPIAVAAVGAVLLVLRLDDHVRAGADVTLTAVLLLPLHLLAAIGAATGVATTGRDALAGLVAVALILAGAALLACAPSVGDVLRAVAAVLAGVVIVAPASTGPLADAAVALPAAALAAAVLTLDTWRTGRAWLAWLAGPVAVRAVAGGAWVVSGSRVTTGLALLGVALVAAAIAARADAVRLPASATGALATILGVGLLAVSAHAVAITLLALGVVTAVAGVLARVPLVAHVGGVTAVTGAWWLTSLQGITALDVWAAPLAIYLWAALVPARRDGRLSSWTADVPPLLLVVVPALLMRADGGPGWHAVLAGTLGVVAVIGGGSGRHGGPLLVGTCTVVAVVAIETLAVVAAVPTWAWLALGGLTLLGAAVLIERTGGAPADRVRRLREVLAERFD